METWTKTGACRGVSGWEDEVDLQLRLCVPQRTTGTFRLRQFQGDNRDLFPGDDRSEGVRIKARMAHTAGKWLLLPPPAPTTTTTRPSPAGRPRPRSPVQVRF